MCICINNFTVHCRKSSETEQIENSWLQLYVHQSASSCLDSSKRIEKSLPACTFNSKLIIANSPNHSRRKWLFNRLYSEQTIYLPNSPYLVYDTCTCISLVRDWKRKLKLITPGSERVFQISWNFAFFLVLWQSHYFGEFDPTCTCTNIRICECLTHFRWDWLSWFGGLYTCIWLKLQVRKQSAMNCWTAVENHQSPA